MRSIWLVIGFLLMFSFPVGEITLLPVLGFALILFAVLRMEKMEPAFKKAKYTLFAAIPIAAVLLALQIYKTAQGENAGEWYDVAYLITRIACEAVECLTMFFIYLGVRLIGMNADVPQLEKQSSRNMTVMLVYAVSFVFITLVRHFMPSSFEGFEIVLVYPFALGYIWRALNVWTAYTLLTKISVSKEIS